MNKFRFEIISRDKKTKAKLGKIITSHGIIRIPAFIPVGSTGSVKTLIKEEIKSCNIDAFFVNTYHMLFRPGIETVKKMNGLHKFMNWNGPIMTDSGGFQAFSLGEYGPRQSAENEKILIRITDNGIYFKSIWDGKMKFLGPDESILAQQTLDSDIMMSFDECTFYPIEKKRAKIALERTHKWAKTCLLYKNRKRKTGALYGIVQGSVFEDLRKESAKFIKQLPFEGFAIGSVANAGEPKEKFYEVLDWTLPILLSVDKPVHFLGVGEIEDILESVERGIDSLDCVLPTRLARMGWVFSRKCKLKNRFRYDISKSSFSLDKKPLEEKCRCFTCQNYSKAYLNHLFRSRELLAYRLITIHNLYFYGNLMEQIREAIAENKFLELKKEWLGD